MNYNTYPQQYMAQQNLNYPNYRMQWGAGMQVRPVASIEEVKASPIEFDGSIFYFPDIANKKIYTKFLSMDGQVVINMYELKEMAPEQPGINSAYITRDEFETSINQLKQMYEQMVGEKLAVAALDPQEVPMPKQQFQF